MNNRKDKKKKHNFWKRIHFKYKLSITNENTLAEVWKMRVSWFNGTVVVVSFAFILITLTSLIIISTPIRNYLPGYLDSEIREQAINSAIQIDSLERKVNYQAQYMDNIQKVLNGEMVGDSIAYEPDSLIMGDDVDALKRSKGEELFTEQFEEEEKYNLTSVSVGSAMPAEGTTFFRPVKGLIRHKFDISSNHYGIDIMTAPKESVVAALEGTVVYAGYDPDAGYVIQIQHKNGFLSVYKNNAMLLKKMGARVVTGEAIAIVGNEKGAETKANLYFELWYKGSPVNPENYISF